MPAPIDQRIKQAQRKGIGVYLVSGALTLITLIVFALWLFFVKGYSLIIGPSDAQQTAKVELIDGLAWVSKTNIYTLGSEVTIAVSAKTFQTSRFTVGPQSPSTINIELLPSPATIDASVSAPDKKYVNVAENTQWFLNGQLIHVGADLAHQVVPGKYQLESRHPYYESATVNVDLARAQTQTLSLGLGLIEGAIEIDSLPSGISVSIDGQAIGNTPLRFTGSGGEYQVELTDPRYQTVTEDIEISQRYLHPSRQYQLAAKQGILDISVQPTGGILLIDNIEYTPGLHRFDTNKAHLVSYKKAGFSDYKESIELSAGQSRQLKITLDAQYSMVSVSANVPANIKLDGVAIGSVPLSKQLPSTQHTLELDYPGYRSVSKTFTANKNKPTSVSLTLLTEFDARRAEGRPLFASQQGINLLHFVPSAYTMGSPANEQGRRRNEHLLNVDFTRSLWVSEKEITRAQFAAFSKEKVQNPNQPITGVSWLQAAEYCNWLSVQEGLPVFYRFVNGRYAGLNPQSRGYRLPTEAEWEWLAKKSKRATSTIYVWGNQEKIRDNLENLADKSRQSKQLIVLDEYQDKHVDVADVASYEADRNGLYDLGGNVSEWVHDQYTNSLPDTSVTHIDYLGANNGEGWVIKGPNFETGRMRDARAAFREFSSSGKSTVGFRIARYHN